MEKEKRMCHPRVEMVKDGSLGYDGLQCECGW